MGMFVFLGVSFFFFSISSKYLKEPQTALIILSSYLIFNYIVPNVKNIFTFKNPKVSSGKD